MEPSWEFTPTKNNYRLEVASRWHFGHLSLIMLGSGRPLGRFRGLESSFSCRKQTTRNPTRNWVVYEIIREHTTNTSGYRTHVALSELRSQQTALRISVPDLKSYSVCVPEQSWASNNALYGAIIITYLARHALYATVGVILIFYTLSQLGSFLSESVLSILSKVWKQLEMRINIRRRSVTIREILQKQKNQVR